MAFQILFQNMMLWISPLCLGFLATSNLSIQHLTYTHTDAHKVAARKLWSKTTMPATILGASSVELSLLSSQAPSQKSHNRKSCASTRRCPWWMSAWSQMLTSYSPKFWELPYVQCFWRSPVMFILIGIVFSCVLWPLNYQSAQGHFGMWLLQASAGQKRWGLVDWPRENRLSSGDQRLHRTLGIWEWSICSKQWYLSWFWDLKAFSLEHCFLQTILANSKS